MTANLLNDAKHLYKNGQYKMCKDVLMSILKVDANNGMILEKLGDVNLKMNRYYDAKSFYEKAIAISSKKPNLYVKYGDLLQFELNELEHAEEQYHQCLLLDNLNQKCLFNFGQLLVKMNQYKKAEKCFLQCLQIDDQKGSVHYHYGRLVFNHLSNTNKALFHLKQSTMIQPNVIKYHYEYAMILKASNQYENANKSFQKALELSDYNNASIIYEYSQFLYQCMNDKQGALNYAKLAAAHDPKYSYKLKTFGPQQIGDKIYEKHLCFNNKESINYTKLKYIIYDIAGISYFDLKKQTNSDLHNFRLMYIEDFMILFGRRDRINRLKDHFKRILSQNIRIGIFIRKYDKNYKQIVIESLKKTYLFQYIEFLGDFESVINVKHEKKLSYNEMLLITIKNEMQQNRICQIFDLPKQFGLTLNNLEYIEENIGIELETIYTKFKTDITSSYSVINFKMYNDIKYEILRKHYGSTDINKLEVIQWINTHWVSNKQQFEHKLIFEEFAQKFMYLCYESAHHHTWTAYNILIPLLSIQPRDPDLLHKKALFLKSLGRSEEADRSFKELLLYSKFITTYTDYAYFLFKEKRNIECERIFKEALELNPVSMKALIGCARILNRNYKRDEAVYYHKKSIAIYPDEDLAHCRYGELLYHTGNFNDALFHYNIAQQLRPNSHKTQYWLSMTHLKMGNMMQFKHHLSYTLQINPNHEMSLAEWTRHFGEYNPKSIDMDTKQFLLNGDEHIRRYKTKWYRDNAEKEFAIFWYHKAEMFLIEDYYEKFQDYYQLFKQYKMNSIWNLFDIDKSILNQKMGIKNNDHIEIILECIEKYVIRDYEDFKNWLKSILFDKTLLQQFMDSLEKHSIYSFDSFYRNMPSKNKLLTILGTQHTDQVSAIWTSFYSKSH